MIGLYLIVVVLKVGLIMTRTKLVKESPVECDSGSLKTQEREWLDSRGAADYLGMSEGALRNMTSNGQIPYYKLGCRNRYRVTDLRALLLAQKRGSSHVN